MIFTSFIFTLAREIHDRTSYHYLQLHWKKKSSDLGMPDLAKSAPTRPLKQPVMKPRWTYKGTPGTGLGYLMVSMFLITHYRCSVTLHTWHTSFHIFLHCTDVKGSETCNRASVFLLASFCFPDVHDSFHTLTRVGYLEKYYSSRGGSNWKRWYRILSAVLRVCAIHSRMILNLQADWMTNWKFSSINYLIN